MLRTFITDEKFNIYLYFNPIVPTDVPDNSCVIHITHDYGYNKNIDTAQRIKKQDIVRYFGSEEVLDSDKVCVAVHMARNFKYVDEVFEGLKKDFKDEAIWINPRVSTISIYMKQRRVFNELENIAYNLLFSSTKIALSETEFEQDALINHKYREFYEMYLAVLDSVYNSMSAPMPDLFVEFKELAQKQIQQRVYDEQLESRSFIKMKINNKGGFDYLVYHPSLWLPSNKSKIATTEELEKLIHENDGKYATSVGGTKRIIGRKSFNGMVANVSSSDEPLKDFCKNFFTIKEQRREGLSRKFVIPKQNIIFTDDDCDFNIKLQHNRGNYVLHIPYLNGDIQLDINTDDGQFFSAKISDHFNGDNLNYLLGLLDILSAYEHKSEINKNTAVNLLFMADKSMDEIKEVFEVLLELS